MHENRTGQASFVCTQPTEATLDAERRLADRLDAIREQVNADIEQLEKRRRDASAVPTAAPHAPTPSRAPTIESKTLLPTATQDAVLGPPIDDADLGTVKEHLSDSGMAVPQNILTNQTSALAVQQGPEKCPSTSSVHNVLTPGGTFEARSWLGTQSNCPTTTEVSTGPTVTAELAPSSTFSAVPVTTTNVDFVRPGSGFGRLFEPTSYSPTPNPHETTDAAWRSDEAYFNEKFPSAASSSPISPDANDNTQSAPAAPWRQASASSVGALLNAAQPQLLTVITDSENTHGPPSGTTVPSMGRSYFVVDAPTPSPQMQQRQGGAMAVRLLTTAIGYVPICGGVFKGQLLIAGVIAPVEGMQPPPGHSIDQLHAELRNIDVSQNEPGTRVAAIAKGAMKTVPKGCNALQIRTFAEQRRQIKHSVCDILLPIYGPLTVSNIREHERVLARYLAEVTHGSHLALTQSADNPCNAVSLHASFFARAPLRPFSY